MLKRLLLIATLLLTATAHAVVPLRYFDTVLGIQRDGSVVVVEKFAPMAVGRKLIWSTSTEYPGTWSIHSPRIVNILQVTSIDGRPLNYSIHRGFTRLQLEIEMANAREFRIVYAVRNAVRFLHDRDELIWHAGEGWRGETQTASVFVQVPPEADSLFRAQTYVSGHGLLPVKPTDAGPDRIWFEMPAVVNAKDQLLTDVAFPKNVLSQPAAGKRFFWFLSANTIVLLPLGTLVAMLLLRALKRLPPPEELSIAPRYEPPHELTVAEVGVLLDDRLDPRDVAATLIDLAVRGYVRLEKCKPDAGMEFNGQDFAIRSLKSKDAWLTLASHERTLLFHTFYGGEWTKLSSLTLRFYAVVPLIQRQVLQSLRLKRMYWTDPDYAPSARMTMLVIFLAIAFAVQLTGLYSFASSWLLSGIAIATSVALVYYFGRGITAKTLKGIRCYQEILGFQDFLNSVERDRLERMGGDLFEKWLPYAIALGVEHHWAGQFEGVAVTPPEWMSGLEDAVFNAAGLAEVLASFAGETRTTLLIMPRGALRGW